MPNQPNLSVQNNFTAGLKTEYTGLNFPENAATDTQNCIFTLIGDVVRREGIDYEANFARTSFNRTDAALSSFKWNNVGGDGSTQIIVEQIGNVIYFYSSSGATSTVPLSANKYSVAIDIAGFLPGGSPFANLVARTECQFASGNGYLFVFHPYLDPFYVAFGGGPPATATFTPAAITVNIRDFEGLNSDAAGLYSNTRPATLQPDHFYNIANQGWDLSKANTFQTASGFYPSNADVWWRFKDTTGVYNPTVTLANTILAGAAPKGSKILNAFNQVRINPTAVAITSLRPKTGTWFQGRVWYAGADAAAQGSHTFSETVYFSQIIITPDQFGFCHQVNDPSDESLFDLLATDGGVIKIQGCGAIYKLFPVQNGLIVFAANGIWFITGSQGIGFAANDYTVTKISGIQSISSTSYVEVLGYPLFWNEEGIFTVIPSKTGGLEVNNITLGSILSFYSAIPIQSKKFARGDYNPVDYIVQWVYRSANETSITSRYEYDRILCFNTANKAFYIYTLPTGTQYIHDVRYVTGPGGSTSPAPTFKYPVSKKTSDTAYQFSFAEERDNVNYRDWFHDDNAGINYVSYFITGYQLHGKAIAKWQPVYLYMFLRNTVANSYKIQGLWEFALSGNSGRWSNPQTITDNTNTTNFGMLYKRHKIRGHGLALQIKVQSVDGKPFDVMGWTAFESLNTNP